MRVYITGIAGLIGSSLAKHYLLKGWEVDGCDSLVGGYKNNVPATAYWKEKDISSSNFDLDLYYSKPHDVVIHCAALAYEGLSVFSPSLITDSIYSNTIKMASLSIANKTKLFINFSSMARYGNIIPPFTEAQKPQPHDPYGLAKLQAEEQLALLQNIYPEFKYYTVVPHNVSGAHQVYNDPYRNVLSIMIHQALQNKPIYIYGDGEQTRSFSHVDDCVKAVDMLVENQPVQKLFNIGPDGNEITINELAKVIIERTKSNSEIIHLDARPREVKMAWCDSSLAKKVLGYKTEKTLYDIIDDIIVFIKLNGLKEYKYNLPIEINSPKVPTTWSKKLFNE